MTCPHPTLRRLSGDVCPLGCVVDAPATELDDTTDAPALDLRELEASILSESLADFFRAGWHVLEASTPLVWGPAYEAVCDHVQATIEDWARRQRDPSFVQRIRDLLITQPPGTLKSRILVYAVAWGWIRWPELRVIALSCNPRVALRDSMLTRDLIASTWYQSLFRPTWTVREDQDAKHLFQNTAGGWRSAHGFDARIVGERADVLLVDDPHDPEESQSDAQRTAVLERWDSSIANRVNDLGSSIRIGACQRTHQSDWAAARIAEGWVHVDLPMLFELGRGTPPTPLGFVDWRTAEDECLDPIRFPSDVIAAERTARGERLWATLYQGRPAPAGGAMVRTSWLRFWRRPGAPDASSTRPSGCWTGPARELPAEMTVAIAADLAGGKATTRGDFNVIVAVGRAGAAFFLLEAWRARADFPVVQRAFRDIASRYPAAPKIVEQAAAGASLVTSLQLEIPGVIGVPPSGSKESRLQSVLAFFEAANVHLPEDWTGLDAAIAELTMFPNAAHDDFVDALSLCLAHLAVDRSQPTGKEIVMSRSHKLRSLVAAHGSPAAKEWAGANPSRADYDQRRIAEAARDRGAVLTPYQQALLEPGPPAKRAAPVHPELDKIRERALKDPRIVELLDKRERGVALRRLEVLELVEVGLADRCECDGKDAGTGPRPQAFLGGLKFRRVR